MDKAEHGRRLTTAMAAKGISRQGLADALGVNVKSVTNWRGGKHWPSEGERARLRQLLGPYDAAGDPVELALESSDLDEWRRDAVRSFYKRNLHEQAAGGEVSGA